MRQIKFRALAVVNDKHNNIKVGDFVFGHYIESGCDAPCIIFGDGEQIEVDKKTLGQLTGHKDKKGFDIYEGDFVTGGVSGRVPSVLIEWSNIRKWSGMADGYRRNNIGFNFDEYYFVLERCEVVGNIHQNPELMEQNQ